MCEVFLQGGNVRLETSNSESKRCVASVCVIMCRDFQYVPSSRWCAPAVSEANIRLTQRRVQARWTALYNEACSPLWCPAHTYTHTHTHTMSKKSLKWLMFNFPTLSWEDFCVCRVVGCSPRSWHTLCPPTLGGLASQGPSSPQPRPSSRSSPSPLLPPAETRTEDEGCALSLRLQGRRRERESRVLRLDWNHLDFLASLKRLFSATVQTEDRKTARVSLHQLQHSV